MPTNVRTSYCVFRATDDERKAIGRAAALGGETISNFCRRAALAQVRQVGTDLIDTSWLLETLDGSDLPDDEDDEDDDRPWQG
jgi:uncharacterized protein (DUF1778 family)